MSVTSFILYSNGYARSAGIRDYISDECWYVPATVNILRRVFHVTPIPCSNGVCTYTVIVNDTCPVGFVEDLLGGAGIRIVNKTFKNLHAFAVESSKPLSLAELRRLADDCVSDLVPGILPDKQGINTYMNYEHPLLAKYFIAIGLVEGHMEPWAWRLPSFIAGVVIVVAVIASSAALAYGEGVVQAGLAVLVASVALSMDPALRAMSSVAMLDVYIGLFTILSVVALIYDRLMLSALFAGLAASVKYSGGFIILGVLPLLCMRGRWRDALRYLVVAAVSFIAVNLPLILYLGPAGWVRQLASALSWHTTSRPSGPPYTNPIGLILGEAPFTLYYVGSRPLLVAYANPFEATAAAVTSLISVVSFIAAWRLGGDEPIVIDKLSFAYLGILLGYVLTYIAGNHTLYSFYTVQFTPLAALILAVLVGRFGEFIERLKRCAGLLSEWGSSPLAPISVARLVLVAGLLQSWLLVAALHASPAYPGLFGFLAAAAAGVEARKYWLAVFLMAAASIYLFYKFLRVTGLRRAAVSSVLYWFAVAAGRGDIYTAIAPVYTVTPIGLIDYYVLGFLSPTPLVLLALAPAMRSPRGWRQAASGALAFISGSLCSAVLSYLLGGGASWPAVVMWLLHLLLGVVGVAAAVAMSRRVDAVLSSIYMALYSVYTPGAALLPVYRGYGGKAILVSAWLVILAALVYPVAPTAGLILEAVIVCLGAAEFVASMARRGTG